MSPTRSADIAALVVYMGRVSTMVPTMPFAHQVEEEAAKFAQCGHLAKVDTEPSTLSNSSLPVGEDSSKIEVGLFNLQKRLATTDGWSDKSTIISVQCTTSLNFTL